MNRDEMREAIAEVIELAMIVEDATYEQIADEVIALLVERGWVSEE